MLQESKASLITIRFVVTLGAVAVFFFGGCDSKMGAVSDVGFEQDAPGAIGIDTTATQSMAEATELYKAAMTAGVIVAYDQATETVQVNETAWARLTPDQKRSLTGTITTLVGYGRANKEWRIVSQANQRVLASFAPGGGVAYY